MLHLHLLGVPVGREAYLAPIGHLVAGVTAVVVVVLLLLILHYGVRVKDNRWF